MLVVVANTCDVFHGSSLGSQREVMSTLNVQDRDRGTQKWTAVMRGLSEEGMHGKLRANNKAHFEAWQGQVGKSIFA